MAKSSNRNRLVSSAPKVPVQPGKASRLQQGKLVVGRLSSPAHWCWLCLHLRTASYRSCSVGLHEQAAQPQSPVRLLCQGSGSVPKAQMGPYI